MGRTVTMALLLTVWIAASGAATPVQAHGQLTVEGNRIVGNSGQTVQLRGMSLFWSQWIGTYWNAEVIRWLADDWKCAIVRAPMAVEHGGYLTSPHTENQKVKAVVDAAIAEGIYVIIDWHDHNASAHTSQARAFFSEMAQTYGSYPNVIYEIFNEPDYETWGGEIKPYAQTVIDAIREHDPDNLVIVGTPEWSQRVDIAAGNPLADPNVAYTLHFYAASHKEALRQRAASALAGGIALFVTEWGTCEYTGDGYLDYNETSAWLDFMDQHGLSWCNWSIADKAETAAALTSGASTAGGWPESQLTPSGTLLRTTLREYAADAGGNTEPTIDTVDIPGTLQAESYCAMSGIQTETTTDQGGGSNIGYIDNGDWAEYAVRVSSAGTYEVDTRVASNTAGGTIEFLVDGTRAGSVHVHSTGGWQQWATVSTTLSLDRGAHVVRLAFSGSSEGLFNINWLEFREAAPVKETMSVPAVRRPVNHTRRHSSMGLYLNGRRGGGAAGATGLRIVERRVHLPPW